MEKKDLIKWDKEYFWHPFTQMKVYREEDNVIVERGEGNYIYDIFGNKYLDGVASLWCNVHGHNHPKLNKAICDQVSKISHFTTLGASNSGASILVISNSAGTTGATGAGTGSGSTTTGCSTIGSTDKGSSF
ncbi:MAG: aminotransferase class III-fold pyridoxal phosphate-dependent enzyme, partial [Sulfurihydrogenibium azorense]